jgi:predicted transcriptional regulator
MAKRGRKGESLTSPRRIESAQKKAKALALRQSGMTYPQIAKELGYNSSQAVFMAVKSALDQTVQEPAEEYRKIVRERLNVALRAIWPKVKKGEKDGIDSFVKLHQEICKLDGLNKQIDVNVHADQVNVQNNLQQNIALRLDLATLNEGELEVYGKLLAKCQPPGISPVPTDGIREEEGTPQGGNGVAH